MDRDTLLNLAARVEAAAGPDRALDAEIALAIGWHNSRVCELWTDERGRHWPQGPCQWTASLDAAVALVPAGWTWCRYHNGDVEVGMPWDDRHQRGMNLQAKAATPALALTAAALRARAEEARGE